MPSASGTSSSTARPCCATASTRGPSPVAPCVARARGPSPSESPLTFRVAVTGANGFVGRNFVRYASALGHEVVGVVRDEAAARSVIADGGLPKVAPELVAEALRPALEGCRALVHLAHIGSERPGATYEGVNVRGTEAVATAARESGVARVVVFSGLGVARYGQKAR